LEEDPDLPEQLGMDEELNAQSNPRRKKKKRQEPRGSAMSSSSRSNHAAFPGP